MVGVRLLYLPPIRENTHMKYEILTKVKYGSHLYGTNTETSDLDYKFIVLPELEYVLRGNKLKNSVTSTGNDFSKNTKEDVDEEKVPIQVFASDFFDGQTYAIELALAITSKNHNVVNVNRNMHDFVTELTGRFLTRNVHSMVGFAFSQAHKYGIKGNRLKAIEQFIDMINESISEGKDTVASLKNKVSLISDGNLYNSSFSVGGYDNQQKSCVKLLEKIFSYDVTLTEALERANGMKAKYGARSVDAKMAGGIDWKAVSNAVRITGFAIDLLEKGKFDLPVSQEERNLILSIKYGNETWETVETIINERLSKIDEAKQKTALPLKDESLQKEFDEFMGKWLLFFYGVGK